MFYAVNYMMWTVSHSFGGLSQRLSLVMEGPDHTGHVSPGLSAVLEIPALIRHNTNGLS